MLFKRKNEDVAPEAEQDPAAQQDAPSLDDPQAVLRDDLGLYHLWYFDLRLGEELARAARINSVFSLATWRLRLLPGETPDPELLRQAAAFIRDGLRGCDIPARFDHERFIAILFDAGCDAASTVAFRIKGDLQVRVQSVGRWQAGIATFQRDGVDGQGLIHAAFRRLDERQAA